MNLYNYEIILLSECWITEQTDISLKGYELFKKVRPMRKNSKRASGGLVCFIKSSLYKGVSNVYFDFEDGLCLKLRGDYFGWNKDLYILNVY